MAGTLELSENLCWMPAGWVYDNALEGMAQHVSDKLRDRLLESLTEINGGHIDLQEASAEEISSLKSALEVFLQFTVLSGASSIHEPAFFEGYLLQLKELDSLLSRRLSEFVT